MAGAPKSGEESLAVNRDAPLILRKPDPPSPWRTALVVAIVCALVFAVIVAFSDVFAIGPLIVEALVDFGSFNTVIFVMVCAATIVLYLLDISYWTGACGKLSRGTCGTLLALASIALGVSLVREYPYLPLCIFILLLPAVAYLLSSTILRNDSESNSAWALGLAFFVSSVMSLIVWLLWVYGLWGGGTNGNNFWHANRPEFAAHGLCNATEAGFEVDGAYSLPDGTVVCTAAFLLWVSPFILFGVLLFIALFLCILGWSLDADPTHTGKGALRVLAIAAFTCMFGMYSVTSIGGAGMKLANVAMSTFFCILVGIVFAGAAAIGRERSMVAAKNAQGGVIAFFSKAPFLRDMARAFALCVGTPLIAFLFALSSVNQCLRRLSLNRGKCKAMPPSESRQPFTQAFMMQLDAMRKWDWGTVLKYMYYLCLVVWVFIYFSKLTYIFFNWLVSVLQPLNFWLVVAIFIVIGLIMFLIPVVPGPAVYLTAGVLVVPLGKSYFSGSPEGFDPCAAADADSGSGAAADADLYYFWLSVAFTSFISWSLKLIAHVMQQKLIGEMLSGYVSVRAIVAPNTTQMKAVRFLLEQPGLTLAKASILCGGPDWPTSVMCGLLKLDVCQMLIGLSPIIVFTTPGTLLGAFMTEPTYRDANLDTVCTLVLLLIQVLMGVAFMHYVNKVLLHEQAALNAYPTDEGVAKLDDDAARMKRIIDEVSSFERAPLHMQLMLISGVVAALMSTYALYFGSSRLFQEFTITDCRDLLGNDGEGPYVLPFIGMKPYGLIAILLMVYGATCLKFYGDCWVQAQAHAEKEQRELAGRSSLNNTTEPMDAPSGSCRCQVAPSGSASSGPDTPSGAEMMNRLELGHKMSSGSLRDSESARDPNAPTPRSRDAQVSLNAGERHHVSTSL